jgi:diguanylate cyclase (GGDEF)-like protein
MHSISTIRTRFTVFISTFFFLVLAVASTAIVGLKMVDGNAATIHHRWFTGTRILGEISDRISEFRLAETYRALAQDDRAATVAELVADEHRNAIAELESKYRILNGVERPQAELDHFQNAWKDYMKEHDAWVLGDANLQQDGPAQHGSVLHRLHEAANASINKLIDSNAEAAEAQKVAADRAADTAMVMVVVMSAAAGVFAIWLLFRTRSSVTKPLGAITSALSQLAAGDRDVRLPELHRDDEIGKLAKAFEVFRASAVALEKAHEATRIAQEQADALARHDALTGLPNRRVFAAELQIALGKAEHGQSAHWILLIDLDRFKPVNDLLGHSVGDLVLCEVSRRLEDLIGAGDTVARLGGDEFAIIAQAPSDPHARVESAKRLAGKVLSAVRKPIIAGESRIEVGASIGIASCPADGTDAEVLFRAADLAMYRAKQDGRGTFRFFEQKMDEDLQKQAALEADLRQALNDGMIRPFYQPLMSIEQEHICGFEVLARWEHPEHGFVPPAIFIPLAEQLGLVTDLTSCILRQACRDARSWDKDVRLAVNIWPEQLQDPILPTRILGILSEENFPPSRLEIEITESALMGDIEMAKSVVTTLQALGITVALDDFGTGYSSLYHLRELKFDKLKIDRSFVHSMRENQESAKIVDAILGLAKSLGVPAVAEGIEDAEDLRRLAERGCDYAQGYFFSKAVPAAIAAEQLHNAPGRKQESRIA